jgi:hypothetical protein
VIPITLHSSEPAISAGISPFRRTCPEAWQRLKTLADPNHIGM